MNIKSVIQKIAPLFIFILKKHPFIVRKVRYYFTYKKFLNLKNPALFSEKIIWLSLYSDTSLWSVLTDKYTVRKYVEERCGKEILNDLYGVYQSPLGIDYESLPESFVLKTTNGCGNNIFVKNKKSIDIKETNNLLDRWLKYPYGELTGQRHYAKINPRIIAEKYLEQTPFSDVSLIDYKFYCIDGNPVYIVVDSDRIVNSHQYKLMRYDLFWKAYPEYCSVKRSLKYYDRPDSLDQMIDYAKRLSEPFSFVRVDFYDINGNVIFGEMTFTPTGDDFSKSFQVDLGKLIKIKE
jgi:hypothetical protein